MPHWANLFGVKSLEDLLDRVVAYYVTQHFGENYDNNVEWKGVNSRLYCQESPHPLLPFPVHSCLSCHPSLLRVDSFTDCVLTESTALIAVSSSYFIIFCRPGSEGNTSHVFCRVGGQAACWVPDLTAPPPPSRALRAHGCASVPQRSWRNGCFSSARWANKRRVFVAPGHTCCTVNTAFFKLLFLSSICHFRNLASTRSDSSNKLLHTQTNRLGMEKHRRSVNS